MPKENTTRFIVLGLLSHEPMSGYDIKKRVDVIVSHFWNVGFAQIYPTLAELESEGLIEKTHAEETKGPQRNVYTATDAGREALHRWLEQPAVKEYTKYEILLKLYFSGGMPVGQSIRAIEDFRERQQQNIGMIRVFRQQLESVLDQGSDHLHYYLTVLFGERVYDAYLTWADDALRLLKQESEKKENKQ